MAELVANCPRCDAKSITFNVSAAIHTRTEYNWQRWYEVFAVCRKCLRSTVFILSENVDGDYDHIHDTGLLNLKEALNRYVDIEGYINIKDMAAVGPPDHIPENIEAVFREGATCLAVDCNNAAGTMFRLCIDLVTREMLPDPETGEPPAKIQRNLGLRLPWLLDNGKLPESLRELSTCVKEDGNDGAHAGTLTKADAEDLLDFTKLVLEGVYTEPERLRLAQERRTARRDSADDA